MTLLILALVTSPIWALIGLYALDRRTARSEQYGMREG